MCILYLGLVGHEHMNIEAHKTSHLTKHMSLGVFDFTGAVLISGERCAVHVC